MFFFFKFFIIVRCIWKVYLFENILSFEIIALTNEYLIQSFKEE